MPSHWRPAAFRLAFWAAAAFAVVMAVLPQPPRVPIDRFGDKIEHIVAFAVLTLLALLAYRETRRQLIVERLSFLGAAIEVVQSIPALNRDCDVRDWIADTVAVALVALVFSAVARRKAS